MCRPMTCKACGKASWAGCGQHVDQVMRGIPKNDRCSCTAEQKAAANKGLFARLLGR
jgi:hypothetical protein